MVASLAVGRSFVKMHGLGNDFVLVDARVDAFRPCEPAIRRICDRHEGVGGDQLLVLEPPSDSAAAVRLRIYNIDGFEAQSCFNATRCAAWLLLREGRDVVHVETKAAVIAARIAAPMRVALSLAAPHFDWRAIPLAREVDVLRVPLASGPLIEPVAVGMGSPHLVCFVDHRDDVHVERYAPRLAADPLLPEGANIGVAEIAAPDRIRLVVWERPGVLTRACGSGACAAVHAARARGLIDADRVAVEMPGGVLDVAVAVDGTMTLTGPVAIAFHGMFSQELEART